MNEIRLYGSVGASFWEESFFTADTVRRDIEGMTGPLTVRINSGGGMAAEGSAIYTLLTDYPGEVHVVVDAVAMSAASLIAMAGDTITMRLGSYMLIHDPAQEWLMGRGTEDEHRRAAAQLSVIANAYAAVYAKRAGIGVEEARQIMRDETVLDGPMAVAMGFATAVDQQAEAEPVARFDYRLYPKAPKALLEGCTNLGAFPGKSAVLAMMAGFPRATPEMKETTMAEQSSETVTEDTSVIVAEGADTPAGQAAGADVLASGGQAKGPLMDAQQVKRIRDLVEMAGFAPTMALDMIERGVTPDQAVAAVLEKRKQEDIAMSGSATNGHRPAVITADARDKFVTGATLSLLAKVNLKGGERNEFSSLSLAELARASIEASGQRAGFNSRSDMIGHAFTMAGAHSTSDFARILQNIQGKAALQGWEEAVETYPLFTRKGTLTDFKATTRVGLGLFSALPRVEEGANYTFGTVGDRGETIALATYGRMLRITRSAIINDDLTILGDVPRKMGRAARRTIGDLVFAILTGNPTMSDSIALFHADHNNLAASGGAPSITTLGAARSAMRIQREAAGGAALNITPKYMLVPAALETVATQLLTSAFEPTANRGHAANPVQGMAELVVDGRLDAASATAWYLAADPGVFDTIEVAYLDGVEAPYVEQQQMWTADGVEMKVRIDAGVAPLDFRTLYRNPGA